MNVCRFAEEIIIHATPEQAKEDRSKFMDKSTGLEMENAQEPQSLLEWFAEKYKDFGAQLEFVTNRSQEGSQFVKGFGGIGGMLRCVPLLPLPRVRLPLGVRLILGMSCQQQVQGRFLWPRRTRLGRRGRILRL